jgi:hypothetical protein
MNMRLKQLKRIFFAAFISLMGLANALAGPAGLGHGDRQDARPVRDGEKFDLRASPRNPQDATRDARDARDVRNSLNEQPKRGSRLTREERRDLRRQINEAGQDIYASTPKSSN